MNIFTITNHILLYIIYYTLYYFIIHYTLYYYTFIFILFIIESHINFNFLNIYFFNININFMLVYSFALQTILITYKISDLLNNQTY